jgi:Ser/Thr protein kinase RdoA (MazF antagonist)
MKPFSEVSYLAQVMRLRKLAKVALKKYPIRVKRIIFINHGENATFKVDCKTGESYLLRIHRGGYHTKPAIQEELNWLAQLGRDSTLAVPRPIKSKFKNLLEEVTHELVGTRQICVFKWLPGRFIEKSLSPRHMFELGQLIARFHSDPPKTSHRFYWTAEGLVGKNPKFGSLESLSQVTASQQKTIVVARQKVFKKLKSFEKKHPKRQGLIHADLHFGNLLRVNNRVGAIDFDDCGFGFFAYDLLIPLISAENILGKKGKRRYPDLKAALINGYKTSRPWDQDDDNILDYLGSARKITMLAWLNSRSDNPRLKKYMKKAVKNTIRHIQSAKHLKK